MFGYRVIEVEEFWMVSRVLVSWWVGGVIC